MIVSVSRRSDIPAFHSDWFMEGIQKGWVEVPNPYRPGFPRTVSLKKNDVDAFVFWTRFPGPLLGCLDVLDRNHIPYYFMWTINHYPDFLEPNMVDLDLQLKSMRDLASRIGPSRVVWRYDPIIISRETGIDFHKKNFKTLSALISPFAHRVIISFLDFYRKLNNRFRKIGITPVNIREDSSQLMELISFLYETAGQQGMEIQTCAEETLDAQSPIKGGKCIDDGLLNRIFGLEIDYIKDPGQRKACLCQKSVDIGSYDSCGFRCVYCYALQKF